MVLLFHFLRLASGRTAGEQSYDSPLHLSELKLRLQWIPAGARCGKERGPGCEKDRWFQGDMEGESYAPSLPRRVLFHLKLSKCFEE